MTLAARLRAALADGDGRATLLAGDHDDLASLASVTPAAVLVPVTDRAEPGVILTRRTDTMRRHAGQVAFPGGRVDPGEDAVAAALREAEVADVFEVPLAFLLDHANHRLASREWQGRTRHYYEISWGDRRIWGATAAMIVNLARRLAWS